MGHEIQAKTKKRGQITELAIDTSSSAIGAIVGYALGGPIGSVAGGAMPPLIVKASEIALGAYNRQKVRAELMVTNSLGDINDSLVKLEKSSTRADEFVRLLRQAIDSDPTLDPAYTSLMKSVVSGSVIEVERAAIVGDSLRGLRTTQLRILESIYEAGGELSAKDISKSVSIPEIELRGVVRDLETRGMIKDLEVHPIRWKIRELGIGLIQLMNAKGE